MDTVPESVWRELETQLGIRALRFIPVGGGMICRAARAETSAGSFFVKWSAEAPPDMFAAEADGLDRLKRARALRVPEVYYSGLPEPRIGMLILEYLEPSPGGASERSSERLGQGLAEMHFTALSPDGAFGLERDNYLGQALQINGWRATWARFYREQRLLPQIALAESAGLGEERVRLLMETADRAEELLEKFEARPALLHGDLWRGNYLPVGDNAAVCDPAVYYGEREMEIAYLELFGGFSPAVFTAYRHAYPLPPEYEERRPLHQLYHLLNHLNHFGSRFWPEIDAVCRRCSR